MIKRNNIWFRCPACDGKLVVDAVAAGCRATCPECASEIPVPRHSTMLPAWVKDASLYVVLAVLLASAAGGGTWFALANGGAPEEKPGGDVQAATSLEASASGAPALFGGDPVAAVREDRTLAEENLELGRRYEELTRWMIENYQGKYPLPERMVDALRLDALNEAGDVSSDLVEILRLTPGETAQVRSAIDDARAIIRQTERDLVTVTGQSELSISYEVPVFPEVGRILREDMFYNLESTLGAPRFDRMLDVAGESMREQLHYFGEASRTLSFEVVLPAKEGDPPPYLLIRDGWMVPDGESVRVTTVKETAAMGLPESYREYRDWIPENFSDYTLQ
jgi:hypothetical protein